MLLSYQERIERVMDSTHITLIEDFKVYKVDSVLVIGDMVYANVNDVHFQDTEFMTIQESSSASIALTKIKITLDLL